MIKKIVSLTSYPKRIHSVHKVIESLFNQTLRVDEIILYLSVLEFPNLEEDLPESLMKIIGIDGFRIKWTEDNLRSHKKYYYVLQEYQDSIVITVDDDAIYSENMVKELMESYERFPNAISSRRARIILKEGEKLAKYSQWDGYLEEYVNEPRMDLCAIGVGGVLYPPGCASSDWFDVEKIRELAENQDDLWLKYNEIKSKFPVVYVDTSLGDVNMTDIQKGALSALNMNEGENDVCIQKLFAVTPKCTSGNYIDWFKELIQQKEFILRKRQYYFHKIQKEFSSAVKKHIYLYGAGKRAEIILAILSDLGIKDRVEKIIVSNKIANPSLLCGIEVCALEEFDSLSNVIMICGVSGIFRDEVNALLRKYDCEMLDIEWDKIIRYCAV